MSDDTSGFGGHPPDDGDLIEIDLNFESMRRFQAEFSSNLSTDGLFIDTGEPLSPGSVVRFRVILPEAFVFLEGTAVVEWQRRAEAVSDGPPGMALRFVTLSPQNQELVEQLVQDLVDGGGEPFNLDVRPVPSDFPTDALEGAPTKIEREHNEAFRLTVRRTGPGVDAEALRALAEAVPGDEAEGVKDGDGIGGAATDQPLDFEIISRSRGASGSFEPESRSDEVGSAAGSAGDPPDLDWPEEDGDDNLPDRREFDVMLAPSEFDAGPEVIDDVGGDEEGLGGPAFDVSLPSVDDEPDTTPVMPDEGRDEVTFSSDEEEPGVSGFRRWWPWALAAVFVLAVAAGLLKPQLASWLESSGGSTASPSVAGDVAVVPDPTSSSGETIDQAVEEDDQESPEVVVGEPVPEGEMADTGVSESEPVVAAVEPDSPAREEDTGAAARPLGPADAVTAVEVAPDPRGTVIRIRGNGSLEEGAVSVEALSSPPRVLIRVRRIESAYRPFTIESETGEVTRVRIGHHVDRRPPELWVVVDLAEAGATVEGIDIRRDLAEFVIVGP